MGRHRASRWTRQVTIGVSAYLPASYAFGDIDATYRMAAFLASPETVLYGSNGEGYSIGALHSYAGGGSFNYMALDICRQDYTTENDYATFVRPWANGALDGAVNLAGLVAWESFGYGTGGISGRDGGFGFAGAWSGGGRMWQPTSSIVIRPEQLCPRAEGGI